jgi:hypothetical protein
MKNWKTTSMGISTIIGALVALFFAWKSNNLNQTTIMACITAILAGIGLIIAKDAGVTGTALTIALIIVLTLTSNTLQAQDSHPLRVYPIKKTISAPHLKSSLIQLDTAQNIYQSKDSTVYLGPSDGIDVFQLETKTGNWSFGLMAGIGYGIKYKPQKRHQYVAALDIFIKSGLTGNSPGSKGPDYFNLGIMPVASILGGYLRFGYGPQWSIGLNKLPNKFTGVLSIGSRIPL